MVQIFFDYGVLTYSLKPKYEWVWTLAINAEVSELFKALIIWYSNMCSANSCEIPGKWKV